MHSPFIHSPFVCSPFIQLRLFVVTKIAVEIYWIMEAHFTDMAKVPAFLEWSSWWRRHQRQQLMWRTGLVMAFAIICGWETLQHVIAVDHSSGGGDHSVAAGCQGSGSRCLCARLAEGVRQRTKFPPLYTGLPLSPVSVSPPLVDLFSTLMVRGRDRSGWWW